MADGSVPEFRAVVECTYDPCTYCHRPRQRYAADHPSGPFATAEQAREHGEGIAHKVYGFSVHRVLIEARQVTPWETVSVEVEAG
ncbi:hypothetical protein [Puerhibacterium puerhi]|uniref:hypothetical protein n=1 Tax=Puerhibacterium puerhi TaxID=2692623 RepID=UPI0013592B0F|nr:hypothetical protein [Puerhibacterium puerhi]